MTVPAAHSSTCPNCGASIRFLWAQAVQTTCPYCKSVLVRGDLDLSKVGEQADFPATGSPIQIGTEGRWLGKSFVVVGRLTYGWERGRWNEWHCVMNDGRSAWLSDAQLEYAMSMQVENQQEVPHVDTLKIGRRFQFGDTGYTVASITTAYYVGTEGELPFTSYDRNECKFADLATSGNKMGTIDGSEYPHLVFLGEYLSFDDLAFRNVKEFEGW